MAPGLRILGRLGAVQGSKLALGAYLVLTK